MSNMFCNCENLESLDLSGWNTSNVSSVKYMFCECKKLNSLDLSGWDTSNVLVFEDMFYECPAPYYMVGNKLRKK